MDKREISNLLVVILLPDAIRSLSLKSASWLILPLLFLAGCVAGGSDEQNAGETSTTVQAEAATDVVITAAATPLNAAMKSYETMIQSDGTTLEFAVVLPAGYQPDESYPILLALPPGAQTRDMVEAGLGSYWEEAAAERGWIVVSPVAPNGLLFFQGSEQYMPDFLARLIDTYHPEGDQFHIAGISNGGISAFRIALAQPDLFSSMVVVPGLPHNEADFSQLEEIRHIPIAMYVGERDTTWLARMQDTEAELKRLGAEISLEIVPGEGHVIQSLSGGQAFFDFFEAHR